MKLVIESKEKIVSMKEMIKTYFIQCYTMCGENKTEVSERLDLDRQTVRKYCKLYSLDKATKVNQFKTKSSVEEKNIDLDKREYTHYYNCITPVTPEERDTWYNLDSY